MVWQKSKVRTGALLIALLGIVLYFIGDRELKPQETEVFLGTHRAAVAPKSFYDDAYKNVDIDKEEGIAGIFVNHHMLAPHLVAQEFASVSTQESVTVVLVSPNHFFLGNGGAISSQYSWETPFGILVPNLAVIEKLKKSGLINIDEEPFRHEHGINTIVGFIKKSLPNAKIVPIIVKDNLPDSEVDSLARRLVTDLPKNSLIVGSLDFSHYLTSNAADFHDIQTIATIRNFDYERIKKLDIDSKAGMRLLLKYFFETGHHNFTITNHTNSSKVTNNFNFSETTSYINGYFTKGEKFTDSRRTTLYHQGLSGYFQNNKYSSLLSPTYAFAKSDRLFKFNDEIVLNKPREIGFLNLGDIPIAVGLLRNPDVTDIYIFPLAIEQNQVKLLAKDKADTILAKIASDSNVSTEIKKQILMGHITIK